MNKQLLSFCKGTMKLKKSIIRLFLILIMIWLVASFIRTIYNISKIFTEELEWLSLSDEEKRIKLFGDLHYFFRFVEKNTDNNSKILLYSFDGDAFYLSVYYLYPRKITYIRFLDKNLDNILKENDFSYLVFYYKNADDTLANLSKSIAHKCFFNNTNVVYKGTRTMGIICKQL